MSSGVTVAAMRSLVVLLLCVGCGSTAPTAESPAAERPTEGTAEGPAEGSAETPASGGTEAPPVPAGPPRFAVPAPADLGAAIAARLPTIELVPQSCGTFDGAVAVTSQRVCLRDPVSGLTRAMRRFSTSDIPTVSAARYHDDVVFAVVDVDAATTRYDRHLWRWSLVDDSYVGLSAITGDMGGIAIEMSSADFGVVVRSPSDTTWLFDGTFAQVRSPDFALDFHVVDGQTYLLRPTSRRYELDTIHRDGPRITRTRVVDFPATEDLLVSFPEGRALVVSAYPRGDTTTLYVVRPPAAEVREVSVAVRRPHTARFVNGGLQLRNREGVYAVDLETGAVTDAPPWTSATTAAESRSFYEVVVTDQDLTLTGSGGAQRLSAEGTTRVEIEPTYDEDGERVDPPAPVSGCRCEETTLVCREARVVAGCTEVSELERIAPGESYNEGIARTRSTFYTAGATYRVDRLEPDLVRITRLSDGVRLWVRVYSDGVFAQADDGAFVAPDALSAAQFALRWGRSLLSAPVTPLAPRREAFLRPTLIADFFAGRPLPAADTTLPEGMTLPPDPAPALDPAPAPMR